MDTQKIEAAVKMIIEAVGEDVNREGLQETPLVSLVCTKRFFQVLVKQRRNICQNPLRLLTIIWW